MQHPNRTDRRQGPLPSILVALWRLAISPITFVIISLLWCLDLGVGSLLAYWRPDLFGALDNYPFMLWLRLEGPRAWPYAIWVHLLVILSWLMVASLFLCTIHWFLFRRKRLRGVGEVLVHLGFLLVFAGYVIGSAFGARTLGVRLPLAGGSATVSAMDVGLKLQGVSPLHSRSGQVQGFKSDLALTNAVGEVTAGSVWINHPLIAGPTVVYPRGVQQQVEGLRILLGGSEVELRAGWPVALPGGHVMEVTRLVQADETDGEWQGPGVVMAVRAPGGEISGTAYLSPQEGMPNEAVLAGHRLRLADLLGPQFAVFDIHRDPGVRLVLVGAFLITLGSLWAFFGFFMEGSVQSADRQ